MGSQRNLIKFYLSKFGTDQHVHLEQWRALSDDAQCLIALLLQFNAGSRPNCDEALNMPWIHRSSEGVDKHIDSSVVRALRKYKQTTGFRRNCLLLMACSMGAAETVQLASVFQDIDTNHDGVIQLSELQRALKENLDVTTEELA